jgi:hypothetical protein
MIVVCYRFWQNSGLYLGNGWTTIEATVAETERLRADIEDSILKTPRSGRVLYRLAEPGEVLPAGGKILTTVDLDDMYMTVFLSEQEAGKVRIGADARIVLDALPHRAFPARVAFVAPKAQFTPKEVETKTEREKLVFRIKARVLDGNDPILKPGMPGVAYIRVDESAVWPERLEWMPHRPTDILSRASMRWHIGMATPSHSMALRWISLQAVSLVSLAPTVSVSQLCSPYWPVSAWSRRAA